MKNLTFVITEDGKLPMGIRETLKRYIPTLSGKKVTLSLGIAKDRRSLEQNRLYWKVVEHVRSVMLEAGDPMPKEHWHETLLEQFAPRVEYTDLNGVLKTRPMRSKEMNVEQMSDYITAIMAEMANRGDPVPMED